MIACFLSNISVKYYKNPSMLSRVIAKNVGMFFWDTMYMLVCNYNDDDWHTGTSQQAAHARAVRLNWQRKAREVFDEGAGRSLCALQITQNITYTKCILSIKIINETSTSYSG